MRPEEIVYRLRALAISLLLATNHRRKSKAPQYAAYRTSDFAFCLAKKPMIPDLPWDMSAVRETANDLLSGNYTALGFNWTWKDDCNVWHRAPDTGAIWPRIYFARIPFRPGNPFGDIRVAWEPARLQQLVALALLHRNESDAHRRRQALDLFRRQLLSFVTANPAFVGIHYISALECGLRILAVCHACDLVRGSLGDDETALRAMLYIVESHARFTLRRLSLHSSTGNHTIGECAALVYAGILFPEFRDAHKWLAIGLKQLEQAAERQVLPDGGGIEQAFHYHLHVIDLLGLVRALLIHARRPVPVGLENAWQRGVAFLRAFATTPASLPAIGDSDSGYALSPFLRLTWHEPQSTTLSPLMVFPDAGYSRIVRSTPADDVLVFDHGPLGMAPAYGHGHADALSVHLVTSAGVFLTDPGTYMYGGDPWLRAYFRGTGAHNTVLVDGADQAKQEAAFMWSEPYRVELVAYETRSSHIRLLARHNGYERQGVTHWRGVDCNSHGRWLVWDLLTGDGNHNLRLHWHVQGEVYNRGKMLCLIGPRGKRWMVIDGGDISLHRGVRMPPVGWMSPSYGRLEPLNTARVEYTGTLPREFTTEVFAGEGSDHTVEGIEAVAWFRGRMQSHCRKSAIRPDPAGGLTI